MANSSFNQGQTGVASTTAQGIVEIATTPQFQASTDTGETGAPLVATPSQIQTALAALSTSVLTMIPKPVVGALDDVTDLFTFSTPTEAYIALYEVPFNITINKISIRTGAVTSGGKVGFCCYSEDGGTKLIDVVSGVLTSDTTNTITLGAPIALTRGNYWFLEYRHTQNHAQYFGDSSGAPFDITVGLTTAVSGEPKLIGKYTITSETSPATIDPTTITHHLYFPWFRLDN